MLTNLLSFAGKASGVMALSRWCAQSNTETCCTEWKLVLKTVPGGRMVASKMTWAVKLEDLP